MDPLKRELRAPVTVLLVILIAVATFLAVRAELNTRSSQENNDRLTELVVAQCLDGQLFARRINTVFDTLIEGADDSSVFSPAEKAERIARYEAAMVVVPDCKEK